jgi:hypothetical protein
MLLKLVVVALIIVAAWCIISKLSSKPKESYDEYYGGRQRKCEKMCFSSPYYDACMNECLQQSAASWTGKPDDYEISALEAPMPLDEETGQSEVEFPGPYRYDYPGH